MEIINHEQGSKEWKEVRLQNFTASEAPAMMNCSKYMSRNELLKLKKTGVEKPISPSLQVVFDKGHQTEAMARPIVEAITGEEFYPVTGILEGTKYLASFDGLTMLDDLVFEHKQWNEILAENVRNNVLEPSYYWQLEQQLLVSGANKAIFVVSNGTTDKMEHLFYESVPDRRLELVAGWNQFAIDLDAYEVEAIEETVIPADVEDFPLIKYQVKETQIYSNITELLDFVRTKSQIELTRELETDQDFADKDLLNKATKTARADLKNIVKSIQNEFVSYSEFATVAADIDKVLQKMQSHGEKQVREAKEDKKNRICEEAVRQIMRHVNSLDIRINPILLSQLINIDKRADIIAAMKGKRTIESLENAADDVVANLKIESTDVVDKVEKNLLTMRELASEHKFLFSDTNQLVTKDNEDLVAVIKIRISDHEKAEKEKADALREEIRIEEEAKAQNKIKGDALIESWSLMLEKAVNAASLEEIQVQLDSIERSPVDEDVFGERHSEAEDIYLINHRKILNLVEAKEAELKETAEKHDLSVETVVEKVSEVIAEQPEDDIPFVDQEENVPHETPEASSLETNALLGHIADWGKKWKVSLEATQELSEILKEHNLI